MLTASRERRRRCARERLRRRDRSARGAQEWPNPPPPIASAVAPGATVNPVKVLDQTGADRASTIAKGIAYIEGVVYKQYFFSLTLWRCDAVWDAAPPTSWDVRARRQAG
jgi:hypothetical protein